MAAPIICLTSALFPHQGSKVAGQDCPTNEVSARISTGESHAQQIHVLSSTAAIDLTVADGMAPMNTMTPALNELMTLRVTENTSKDFVDRLKPVTPINVNLLESMLIDHPDRDFVVGLCSGLREGFKIGYQGPRQPYVSKNLKTAYMLPDIVDSNLLDEVKLGHTIGPFTSPPFKNFQIYPLGLVPKKNSSKWRTIFHLSYPKTSDTGINANISSEDYSLQYVRIDDAIRILLKLGPNCFMAKTDVQSAFRNIPVHPDDWELLGMKWRGLYFFDRVLPFGLRSAPYIFNMLSDALEWILINKLGVSNVLHILDDFFIADGVPRSACLTSLCKLLCLFTELNVPIAPGKTYAPTQTLEFLGITLDSIRMLALLPDDKLNQARILLKNWRKRSSCQLRELQSLIGVLQFACRVIAPGRTFLRRMIALTCGVKQPYHFVRLTSGFHKDLAIWEVFLKHWNGISLFLESEQLPSPSLQLYTDAAGSIGFGGYLAGQWFQGRWLPKQNINKKSGISIVWQELYPIYLACRLWGAQWTTKRIVFFCDNESVVHILNQKTSKSQKIMDLLRPIVLCTLENNFTFTAKHVRGLDNSIADSLSRFQMGRFKQLVPLASPLPCVIPASMIQT